MTAGPTASVALSDGASLSEKGRTMAHPSQGDFGCESFRLAARLSRRRILQVSGLAGIGLLLPDLYRAQARAKPAARGTFGRARSVIMLYLHGGHAQQETWDP